MTLNGSKSRSSMALIQIKWKGTRKMIWYYHLRVNLSRVTSCTSLFRVELSLYVGRGLTQMGLYILRTWNATFQSETNQLVNEFLLTAVQAISGTTMELCLKMDEQELPEQKTCRNLRQQNELVSPLLKFRALQSLRKTGRPQEQFLEIKQATSR